MTPDTRRPVGDLPDRIGLASLERVAAHSRNKLLAIPWCGPMAVGILADALEAKGLDFRAE